MSEQRKYRSWSAQQKIDRVGGPSRRAVGEGALSGAQDRRHAVLQLARQAPGGRSCRVGGQGGTYWREGAQAAHRELERTLGRKTYELEIAGEALRGWE